MYIHTCVHTYVCTHVQTLVVAVVSTHSFGKGDLLVLEEVVDVSIDLLSGYH